jgi:hypothetical protein
MARVAQEHLLTAAQMAQFVRDGYLLFEAFVPQEMNAAVYADQEAGKGHWQTSEAIRAVFDWEPVKGILQSLVGENPVYDHSALHIVRPNQREAQAWHADSIIDARPYAFDMQAMYFSHDCPKEMGPTLILPGSHLRRTSHLSISRYKNIVGQKQFICKAGTIAFLHQGIWHCAQPNQTAPAPRRSATRAIQSRRVRFAGSEARRRQFYATLVRRTRPRRKHSALETLALCLRRRHYGHLL